LRLIKLQTLQQVKHIEIENKLKTITIPAFKTETELHLADASDLVLMLKVV
jgi:hypothetical protein